MSIDGPVTGLDSPTVLVVLDDPESVLSKDIGELDGDHEVRRVGDTDELLDVIRSGGDEFVAVIALSDPDRRSSAVERVRMEHPGAAVVVVAQQAATEEVESLHRGAAHTVVVEQTPTQRIVSAAMEARLHTHQLTRVLSSAFQPAALLEHLPAGILLTDPAGKVLSANPAACRMLGYTEVEICMLGRADLVDALDASLASALTHQAEHGWVHARLSMIRAGGDRFPADVTSVAFTDSRGRPCTTTLFQDVTAQVQTEQELRESEHRFRALLDSIPDPTFMKDAQGRYVYANVSWEAVSKLRPEQYLGSTDFELWPHLAPHCVANDQVALATGQVVTAEDEVTLPDGSKTVIETVKAPVRSGRDGLQGVVCVARDVTKRRRAMDALRDSEARFVALVENSPDVVARLDRDGRILFVSKGVARLGWSQSELIGQLLTDVTEDPEYAERTGRAVETVFRTGEATQFELASSKGPVLEYRIVPEKVNSTETVETVLVLVRDVTEQRNLEAQLRQAQRLDAVGRLAAGVAHDFNNLLTAIRGHADFVMETFREDDPARADVKSIQDTVERAVALSGQLLAFSRKQQLDLRVVDPARILNDLIRILKRIIGEDVELNIECNTDRAIHVDPTQFEQVIVNLVVNARDAQPEGGRIDVTLTEQSLDIRRARALDASLGAGAYVVLGVSDRGTGIDPETLDHMFEPFYTTKPEGRGTGLGLPTVYGIVRQSDGWIDVKTAAGIGTTFMVGFPALDGVPDQETMDSTVRTARPDSNTTILVVEDEGPVLEVCRRTLTAVGYRVLAAENGDEAIAILRETADPVDLIVTDVVMPGMTGADLLRAFKNVAPDTSVMFMSGHAFETLEEHGFPVDEVAFLSKPFDSSMLREKVAHTLKRNAERRASRPTKPPPSTGPTP